MLLPSQSDRRTPLGQLDRSRFLSFLVGRPSDDHSVLIEGGHWSRNALQDRSMRSGSLEVGAAFRDATITSRY